MSDNKGVPNMCQFSTSNIDSNTSSAHSASGYNPNPSTENRDYSKSYQNYSTVANSVSFRFSINDKLHNATEGGGANV